MKIKAKVGGELNMHGFGGVHWLHKAGDERDFPEETGERILTNSNYEKAGPRKASPSTEKKIEITAFMKSKAEPGKKETEASK